MTASQLKRKVRRVSGHWLWTGATQRSGYGVVRWTGQPHPITAHRAAYLAFKGPVRADQDVHHTCGVRACINPAHLVALGAKLNRNGRRIRKWDEQHGHTRRDFFDWSPAAPVPF